MFRTIEGEPGDGRLQTKANVLEGFRASAFRGTIQELMGRCSFGRRFLWHARLRCDGWFDPSIACRQHN
jgi:hypothetical protein